MMRRKWLFWLPEENANSGSAPSSHADTEACREWTPFLTALFDGEADEEGALRARRHLLVCERCAHAWLDWNQTRSLLINHSAPPPPPSLLWRIRLACRLGHPTPAEPAVAQLSAQILARTTRQSPQPAWSFASLFSIPRVLRLNTPFVSALAMGAFVLFIARDSLLGFLPPSPPAPVASATTQQSTRPHAVPRTRIASIPRATLGAVRSKIAAPLASTERDTATTTSEPHVLAVTTPRHPATENKTSLSSLERARRERESLQSSPVRLASYNASEPLPMLASPRPVASVIKESKPLVQPARPPKLAHLPRIAPRPVASAPQIETPVVVLASFDTTAMAAPEPTSAPAPRPRRMGRTLLASAPLRISAPHALPITMSQPTTSDDAGLDELDSTVQEYRSTFADDTSDLSSDTN